MTDVIELARRIVNDNTCVIEGNYDELQDAWACISQWRMSEECKERNLDYDWINQLNSAEHAIRKRVAELKEN
tara:strand:- start:71 stop:289 length:219 start_codon:yes stop_codon:yes gene_type:complete